MVDFGEVITANSRRFREVLAEVPATTRVPSCPDWAADDLLWHLTEVQSFWSTILDQELQTDDQVGAVTAPGRVVDRDAALALFERVSLRLSVTLDAARDDDPVWTWTADHTVGWVRRRQAQEALMHRVDAELTAGLPSEIDPELAEDGVDELLTQFGSEPPAWGAFDPSGSLVEVRATASGRSWWVRLGRFRGVDPDGTAHDEPDYQPVPRPDSTSEAALQGTAGELLLWLWGRAVGEGISQTGDPRARSSLRAAIAANTQ